MEPTGESISRSFLEMGRPVPDLVQALNARQAVLTGDRAALETFTRVGLGRWSGWSEPVSTALIGPWADPFLAEGQLSPDSLQLLKREASSIHRQLAPVWRRKIDRSRLLLLDTPLGDGLTLYDLISNQSRPEDSLLAEELDDSRVPHVLRRLTPEEAVVAARWAADPDATWPGASLAAGHTEAFGERVRRKLRRLGNQHTERTAAAKKATP
ncbi:MULTISPECIES: hypothetical protein [unclassified Kitasatospora]|uniref:hypothetical protein n=1 Tax=unclassified Kitasatospora TaxID=2633591 RepID=UPI0012F87AB5|nr:MULTISPECIES: hypothetical protein [unclassified Kitasatospora]